MLPLLLTIALIAATYQAVQRDIEPLATILIFTTILMIGVTVSTA